MRTTRPPDFHSRLDVPERPPKTVWSRLHYELQRQVLLSFYPHPDSFAYPTRSRLLVFALSIFFGALVLGWYWADTKRGLIPHYFAWIFALALMGLLFFLKVYFRLLPAAKDVFIFPILLWLGLPLFFFLDFFFLGGARPSSEYLVIMLLLYGNLLHWRVSGAGCLLALLVAALIFYASGGHFFVPSDTDWFAIVGGYVVGLASSYTFGLEDKKNFEKSGRILYTVGKRMQAALSVQLALSEALRHEAANTHGDKRLHQQLLELAQRLDVRANLTRAELQEAESQVLQADRFSGVQLLGVVDLHRAATAELRRTYGVDAEMVQRLLQVHGDTSLVLQGEWDETVEMLASVLAMMLRVDEQAVQTQTFALDVHWQTTAGQVQMEMQRVGSLGAFYPSKGGTAWQKGRKQENLAEQLLPAYSSYVLQKMGAQVRVGDLQEGTPAWLLISWPTADMFQNRLTGYKPLSLMQMYEDRVF